MERRGKERRVRSKRVNVEFKEWQSGKGAQDNVKMEKMSASQQRNRGRLISPGSPTPSVADAVSGTLSSERKSQRAENTLLEKFYGFFILISLPFDIMGNIGIRFMSSPISVQKTFSRGDCIFVCSDYGHCNGHEPKVKVVYSHLPINYLIGIDESDWFRL